MSLQSVEVIGFLDSLFADYPCETDYSRNGLQVQGRGEIDCVAFAVDASQATLRMAAQAGAGLFVCHHGLFWNTGFARLLGADAERIRILMKADMGLYGMHLPLDAHCEIGNNARLAEILQLVPASVKMFARVKGLEIGCVGDLQPGVTAGELSALLDAKLDTKTRLYGREPSQEVKRVAIVSGGGDSEVVEAAMQGADVLVTGELSHSWWLLAQELGLGVLVAGHYATETVGVRALMQKVQAHFPELTAIWLDAPTGL